MSSSSGSGKLMIYFDEAKIKYPNLTLSLVVVTIRNLHTIPRLSGKFLMQLNVNWRVIKVCKLLIWNFLKVSDGSQVLVHRYIWDESFSVNFGGFHFGFVRLIASRVQKSPDSSSSINDKWVPVEKFHLLEWFGLLALISREGTNFMIALITHLSEGIWNDT